MLHLFCKQCDKKVEAVPLDQPKADFIATCPHCGSLLSPHRVLTAGTEVNGFRVIREIGRGGMGIVYLAKQLDLDRDVALKVLSDEMASDSTFIDAFFREARGAAALNHPNIVQAIDAGISGDIHYFVMELIEGENLEVYTAGHGALPTPLALKCATSIADALTYAWDCKKLAHRDIKPENIIMKNNSEFKLADLGLVKDCREGAGNQDENLMATPAYAPPEVIRGEKDVPGFKSDMYSFGATLYQLFAGHAPFVHDDPMVVCEMQQENQPPPLIAVNPDLPPEISMLVDKLMEKDPGKRPASWGLVLHTLNEITYSWHVTNQAGNTEKPEETGNGKQKILIGAAALLAVLFLAELVLFFLLPEPQKKNPVKPVKKTVVQQPVTPQSVSKPSSPPAQTPAPEVQPVITVKTPPVQKTIVYTPPPQPEKDPLEEIEDDPGELKHWKKTIKPVLPDEPYDRWEALKDYLDENLYAPKEARKMFRDLEKKEKTDHIENLKRLNILRQKQNASLKLYQELEKAIETAPLWAGEVFTLEDIEAIRTKTGELKLKQEKLNAFRQQAAELRRQKSEKKQLRELTAMADADLLRIRNEALAIRSRNLQKMISVYKEKYADLPDYESRAAKLAKLAEINKRISTPISEIIRLNQKHFKGQLLFPTHFPTYTFRNADENTLYFIEKNGRLSTGQKLHVSWIEENRLTVMEDLLYQNIPQLQELDSDTLVTIFLIAHCSNFSVKRYLAKYSWMPRRCRKDVLNLLDEITKTQK